MKRFKNILYVNETGVNQTSAMARAVSLAKHNQADLTVVDVIPDEVIAAAVGLSPNGPSAEELKADVAAVDIDLVNPLPTSRDLNRTILELAGTIALGDNTSLHLAHAWDATAEQTFLS